jgi:hypothetical protein
MPDGLVGAEPPICTLCVGFKIMLKSCEDKACDLLWAWPRRPGGGGRCPWDFVGEAESNCPVPVSPSPPMNSLVPLLCRFGMSLD